MGRTRRGSYPVHNRRSTAWELGTGGTTSTNLFSSTATFIGSAVTPLIDGNTIIRIRGFLKVVLLSTDAVSGGFSGAFGIGLASEAAVAAGIASVPTPITEQGSENWLYWRAFAVDAVTATIADGVNAFGSVFEVEIDSKAMRKFPEDLSIYACTEVVEAGVSSANVWHDSRLLIKLP